MTEIKRDTGGGGWKNVVLYVMGVITLLSTGWASSSTTGWWVTGKDIKRIDERGTQKTALLETRVTHLETVVDIKLQQIFDALKANSQQLKDNSEQLSSHIRDMRPTVPRGGS